ncbi:uncharacterized protein LOC134222581 [Armigeres subalbatus]|uniref:uncharacterized protein LOC134222581 n=1 Tax=Armigeres subalbatus TaxID=124917 RepID=UPI002ED477F2
MPDTRAMEIEQLKQQIAELTNLVRGNSNTYQVPDPIKQLSEFSGNKNELTMWLDEVDQLYNTFKVKGQNGAPDSMNAYYIQAIKNKIKGDARQILCVNGNPATIPDIKKVLLQHYGDQRDIATNININGNHSSSNTKPNSAPLQKFKPISKFTQKPASSHTNRKIEMNSNLVQSDDESDDDEHNDGNAVGEEHDPEQQIDELNFQMLEYIEEAIDLARRNIPSSRIISLAELEAVQQFLVHQGLETTLVENVLDIASAYIIYNKDTIVYILKVPRVKNAEYTLNYVESIKCPKQFANTMTKSIDRITRGIRSAIKHCADETNGEDVEGLRHDIRNAPFHAFGVHDDCRSYFCKNKQDVTESQNIVLEFQSHGIWDKITLAVEKSAAKAEFFSENRTSNLVENLYCRLSKYNVGKRVDTMSRGSYQRRVFITVLQHNEGYKWHDEYMYRYTGERPGYWLRRMFQRKNAAYMCTKKIQSSPGFVRRKPVAYEEIERDYGEDAVDAAEQNMSIEIDILALKKKYEMSESSKQLLLSDLTMAQMEEFAFGRILSKYVPEIIGSRESTKNKKCEFILQTTNTWNFLKSNRHIIGLLLRSLRDRHSIVMGGTRMFVDSCHNYLCCVPDAISEDGSTVLLLKKDQRKVKKITIKNPE